MEYVLEMKDISKTFPGVKALDHVQLQVKPGEVHALMGENGAGKSTLMKILMGIYTKDSGGEIIFNGQPYHVSNPKEAMDHGVAMIHQELNPILDMSVYENIFVGREIRKNGLVDAKAEIAEAEKLIKECGLHVSPKEKLRNLTVAQCQLIEIIKAISINAKVIVMDEPTAAITDREVELLFEHIRSLTAKGVAIIYISHRMAEIFSICDRVSVYRDGQYIGSGDTKDLDEAQLIKMMVGREITDVFPKLEAEIGDVVFEAKNIVRADNKVKGVSLSVRRGEILGIGGLVGAGRSELVEGIFGMHELASGEIFVKGKQVKVHSPKDIIKEGVALITEDRKVTGLNLSGSVNDNIAMVAIKKLLSHGLYNKNKARAASMEYIKKLNIKTPSGDQITGNLSGGNQQKIVIAKWLLNDPDIIILDEPTNHLDMESISWLEGFLSSYQGSVIIVSHDRYFLDKIVTKIVELDNGHSQVYNGNYTYFAQKRAEIRENMMKAYLNQQQEIKHQEEVITKLKQFNREKSIKRAESREKMLSRIERLDKPTEVASEMRITHKRRGCSYDRRTLQIIWRQ